MCMIALIGAVYSISNGEISVRANATLNERNTSVLISKCRGVIYDRNMLPIAGKEITPGVLVEPLRLNSEETAMLKANALGFIEESVEECIALGVPFYCPLASPLASENFISLSGIIRYKPSCPAQNLLGYVNSDGQGVGGIEEFFNSKLASSEQHRVSYSTDALGAYLDGLGLTFTGPAYGLNEGIVLTIDTKVQEICDAVANECIENGAVVVQEVKSGNILACASRPTFNPYNIYDSLAVEESFLNKAFEEYCCGSAFKIVVTAAALENSDEVNFGYNCTGHYKAGSVKIGCSNTSGHGKISLKTAFAKSCNTYFCNLAQQLGAKKVYEMAEKLGFGSEASLGYGFSSSAGNLPSVYNLSSPAALANFSIGQGDLLVTPLQVSNMTNIIASGGIYYEPKLIIGFTSDGKSLSSSHRTVSRRVLSKQTAEEICDLMEYTVLYGTGVNAAPVAYGAGAKTSTAETGIYKNGTQVYHTWVTGFVPANTPLYSITVLVEGGESGYYNAAPVMKKIADGLIAAGLY